MCITCCPGTVLFVTLFCLMDEPLPCRPLTDLCCCQPVAKWAPPAAARSHVISNAAAAVELELLRASALDQLRHSLASFCAKAGLRNVPLLAFERWRFAAKWAEDEQAAAVVPSGSKINSGTSRTSIGSSNTSKASKSDPVLPYSTATAAAEPGLQHDLQRAGLNEAAAASVALKLAQASAAAAETVKKRQHQLVSGKSSCCPPVAVAFHRHSVDFTCSGRFSKVGSGSNTLLHTESCMLPAAVIQQLQHSCETADPAVMTALAVGTQKSVLLQPAFSYF